MRGAFALLVLLCGCDAVLRLAKVSDRDAGLDTVPDAAVFDAPTVSTCTSPTVQANEILLSGQSMSRASLADTSPVRVVFELSGDIYLTEIGGSSATRIVTQAVSPALSRDGVRLYYVNSVSGQTIEDEDAIGNGSFVSLGQITSPPITRPGNTITVGPEQRMVATTTTGFQELTSSDGGHTWTAFGNPLTAATLGATGTIVDPTLSADGLVVAFVEVGSGSTIAYAHRASIADSFDNHDGTGVVVSSLTGLATPYLTADCTALYAVDVNAQELAMFSH